jgi:hypothetical protein
VLQDETRHSHEAVDVRLEDRSLVLLGRIRERLTPERETRGVDEDVRWPRLLDEARATLGVGDVELERDVRLEPLDPPRAADDTRAFRRERAGRRSADSARRAGDDRRPAVELAQCATTYDDDTRATVRFECWPWRSFTSTVIR